MEPAPGHKLGLTSDSSDNSGSKDVANKVAIKKFSLQYSTAKTVEESMDWVIEDLICGFKSILDRGGLFDICFRSNQYQLKSAKEFEPKQKRMSKGLALILNVSPPNFCSDTTCTGKFPEVTLLRRLFCALDCEFYKEAITTQENWTREQLQQIILEFRNECDILQPRYIFIYISAAGKCDSIFASDGSYINLITNVFDHFYDFCPNENPTGAQNLRFTPKILFLSVQDCDVENCYCARPEQLSTVPCTRNMLRVLLRTKKSSESRKYSLATGFIMCIVFVIMNLVHAKSFLDMLKLTKRILVTPECKNKVDTWRTPEITDVCFDAKFRFDVP